MCQSYSTWHLSMFQKKYPDIYLTLETGMSGDDGVTRTDALKTLNTEIMAGKGPDILILDGISSETYVEQGMLEDLSGILKAAGLLSNIEEAYKSEDGSIYEMPVKFGVPMIEGKKEDVDAVTDLTSLADVTEKHKEEYGLSTETFCKLPLAYSMYPKAFLEELADDNSAAWVKENGTLDEEKVKEFLEQAGRIYQAGKDAMDELKAAYPQAFDDSEQPVYERAKRELQLCCGRCLFSYGFCICDFHGRHRFFLVLWNLEWTGCKLLYPGEQNRNQLQGLPEGGSREICTVSVFRRGANSFAEGRIPCSGKRVRWRGLLESGRRRKGSWQRL